MAGFEVVSVELRWCGSMLSQLGAEVREQLSSVAGEVDGLLGAGWRGRAADGFAGGWRQWQAGADEVIDGLAEMAELLGATGRDYDAAEGRAIATIEGAGAGL